MRNQGHLGLSCGTAAEVADGQMVTQEASDHVVGESSMNLQMPIQTKNLRHVPAHPRTSLSPRRPLGRSVMGCALCSTVKLPAHTVCTICGEPSPAAAVDVIPRNAEPDCPREDIATAGWHELVLLPLLEAIASGTAKPEDAGPALRDLRSMLLKRKAAAIPPPPSNPSAPNWICKCEATSCS